jgi:hypothetical protein
MWIMCAQRFMHAVEHVAAPAPAMAGNFSD